jgi:hypothetical protein
VEIIAVLVAGTGVVGILADDGPPAYLGTKTVSENEDQAVVRAVRPVPGVFQAATSLQ